MKKYKITKENRDKLKLIIASIIISIVISAYVRGWVNIDLLLEILIGN